MAPSYAVALMWAGLGMMGPAAAALVLRSRERGHRGRLRVLLPRARRRGEEEAAAALQAQDAAADAAGRRGPRGGAAAGERPHG